MTTTNNNLSLTKSDFNREAESLDYSKYKEILLTIENFPNLKKISMLGNNKIKEINIENLEELIEIEIMTSNVEKIVITNCKNLKILNCQYNNNLTNLNLSNCKNLMFVDLCNNNLNELTLPSKNIITNLSFVRNNMLKFDFSTLGKNLEVLDIYDNQLEGNLSDFSHLENLRILRFDNNNFYGSFKSISHLNLLKTLSFYNNPIVPSFEWLREDIIHWFNENYLEVKLSYINKVFKELSNISSSNSYNVFFIEIKLRDYEKILEVIKKEILFKRNFKSIEEFETIKKKTEDVNGLKLTGKDLENFKLFKKEWEEFEGLKNNLERIESQFSSLKFLATIETVREQLRLAFGQDQNDNNFYWTRDKLTEEILTSANNGFRLWLDSEISALRKLRVNFYWKLIEEEISFKKEEFESFFIQYC